MTVGRLRPRVASLSAYVLPAALMAACGGADSTAAALSCADLAGVQISGATLSSSVVPAGTFQPPTNVAALTGLPEFCRVSATVKPAADSNVRAEAWFPTSGWNGKFLGTGNGGLATAINYTYLAEGVKRGYAVFNADLGTSQGAASVIGHPEMIADYGHRATHAVTTASKTLAQAFYAKAPTRSYFVGCSTGGGQGLHEAQRYPDDYNGIIAGAPGHDRIGAHVQLLWRFHALQLDSAGYIPPAKLQLLATRVTNSCDALDGVTDGLISRPDLCSVDPAVLQCTGDDAADCLTAQQVATAKKIYQGPRRPASGALIQTGFLHGSETLWDMGAPGTATYPYEWPFWWTFGANWTWRQFDFDRDLDTMITSIGPSVNALSTNLSAFQARGGKIIFYQGLADQTVAPGEVVRYMQNVETAMPGQTKQFMRLFNAPGMLHCQNGNGPNAFGHLRGLFPVVKDASRDMMTALEEWVEKGTAPERIVATKYANNSPTGAVERTRPLCAWPKLAAYNGSGDTNDAANFSCVAP